MNNPYEILGLDSNATSTEVQNAYMNLKTQYGEQRFTSGSQGEEATRKLEKIEEAYKEILSKQNSTYARQSENNKTYGENNQNCKAEYQNASDNEEMYKHIEDLIRNDKLPEAQKCLDDMSARTAEWHYLQSIIYYKKNWYLESKKQLEFALNLDPKNQKYQNAMDKLTKIMANKTVNPESFSSKEQTGQAGYAPRTEGGSNTCTGSCCGDMCLANMCCNCGQSCCFH